MPRIPGRHSPNWGGDRRGAGRPLGLRDRLCVEAVKTAEQFKLHPLNYLLELVGDTKQPTSVRLAAAGSALPYISPKLASTEVTVRNDTDDMTPEQLLERIQGRLASIQQLRPDVVLPVIEGQVVEATESRYNASSDDVDADDGYDAMSAHG